MFQDFCQIDNGSWCVNQMAIYYIIGLSPYCKIIFLFVLPFLSTNVQSTKRFNKKVLFTKKGNQKSSINSLWDLLYPLISLPILYGSLEK